jgi:starch phosphorylase
MTERLTALARLPALARNLWWSWHPEARALFEVLQRSGAEPLHHNPLELLETLGPEGLEGRAGDPAFLTQYREVLAAFDAEMSSGTTWFASRRPERADAPVAYLSAEFGVHSALPVYAGGLGVLAGDIAKEASDLGVPLVGVGFMYPQGYFHQHVAADGRQEEHYERVDRALAPVEPACTEDGRPCVVSVPLPGRELHVAVWLARLGRARLYLMDTDLGANAPWDRELSARLYGGDQELRLRQEILLGIGGVRLVRALGIAPGVWHANEGHSAFMMVERVRELVEAGRSFEAAADTVKATTVFTTHTPVPAGHDAFPFPLVEKYLGTYWPTLGLDRDRFLALGAHDQGWGAAFNMTDDSPGLPAQRRPQRRQPSARRGLAPHVGHPVARAPGAGRAHRRHHQRRPRPVLDRAGDGSALPALSRGGLSGPARRPRDLAGDLDHPRRGALGGAPRAQAAPRPLPPRPGAPALE